MDGYYDPVVTHVLPKPLAICGFWGAKIPDVGAYISSYTGISFTDLERRIEHHLGRSLRHYVSKESKIIAVERACLEKLSRQSPCVIIALRPETLFDDVCALIVQESMDLVFIDTGPNHLQQGIEELVQTQRNNRFFLLDDLDWTDPNQLAEYCLPYRSCFLHARDRLIPQRNHPRYVAQEVIATFLSGQTYGGGFF